MSQKIDTLAAFHAARAIEAEAAAAYSAATRLTRAAAAAEAAVLAAYLLAMEARNTAYNASVAAGNNGFA